MSSAAEVIPDVINTNLPKILDPKAPSSEVMSWCNHVCKLYGKNVKKIILGPNWSVPKPFDKPEGFLIALDKDTPLIHDILPEEKLYAGTCALYLKGAKTRNGTPFTVEYINKEKEAILQTISTHLPQSSNKPPSREYYDNKTQSDISGCDWKPSLSGGLDTTAGSPFGGLYSSTYVESEEGFKDDTWLLISSYSSNISKEIIELMKDFNSQNRKDATWENFFIKNREMAYLYNCSIRNRKKLLYNICTALDIDLKTIPRSPFKTSAKQSELLIEPTIDTTTNEFFLDSKSNTIIYYDNCTDLRRLTSGVIFNENPLNGCTIFKGPQSSENICGGNWMLSLKNSTTTASKNSIEYQYSSKVINSSENYFGLFPVNSGTLDYDGSKQITIPSRTIVWKHSDSQLNSRLTRGRYRVRTSEFDELIERLGHRSLWGEIRLRPMTVKIAADS